MKNIFMVVICAVLVAGIVSPGLARDRDYQQEEKRYLERYHDDLKAYNDALRDKERLLREKEKALQEQERQQYAVPTPPAREFVPVQPIPVPVPVAVPVYGYRYYSYYDYDLCDWVFIRLWCHRDWRVPHGWRLAGPGDGRHFRRFASGRVEGRRLIISGERRPAPPQGYVPRESRGPVSGSQHQTWQRPQPGPAGGYPGSKSQRYRP